MKLLKSILILGSLFLFTGAAALLDTGHAYAQQCPNGICY